jgi:uncharacterized protein
MQAHHDVRSSDVFIHRLHGTLAARSRPWTGRFLRVAADPGVGARTVQSPAIVAEVVQGASFRFRDPPRFSLAHGGKDCPYPVPISRTFSMAITAWSAKLRQVRSVHRSPFLKRPNPSPFQLLTQYVELNARHEGPTHTDK